MCLELLILQASCKLAIKHTAGVVIELPFVALIEYPHEIGASGSRI